MNESDEILDTVTIDDETVGTIKRGELRSIFAPGQNVYVRYSCCFVRNSEGKLWIPRRTATKKIAPNGLDFSAAEHVQSGESYAQAAVRGLDEELNIQVSETELHFVGKVPPNDERRSFSSIYIIDRDDVPHFNTDDFVSYEWLSPAELRERLLAGAEAKYDLLPAAELL